ncbi:uncharacterized protein ISCGN_005975 [Ixodes scapularis]
MANTNPQSKTQPGTTQERAAWFLQWNCRTFARKKAEFLLRYPAETRPVVLLLQEAQDPNISLPGYDTYTRFTIPHRQRTPNGPGSKAPPHSVIYRGNAAVLVAARISHNELDLQRWCTQHQEVVRVALQLSQCKVVVVSIYVRPPIRNSVTIDWSWVEDLRKMHPDALVIGGDFNTRHTC